MRLVAPLALGILGALLLGGSSPTRAQSTAVRLDIDACPGLAGQPLKRRDLISEYISIPSIEHPPGTPAVLDRVQFIRIRERNADPHKVDAVLLQAIPNGGGGITEMGTQIVETAARGRKNFELWVIERRERNLEDLTGMREAFSRGDPTAALHYYYGEHWTDANGKLNGKFGGPGATFVPLTQNDVPFLADWDAGVMFGDVESIMDLVPQRKTHLFAYSAAPAGGFLAQLAGVKLHDGKRGYQELAGLIPIEGQLSRDSVGTGEPTPSDIAKYISDVQAIRNGKTPRFLDNDYTTAISPGPNVQITNSLVTLFALFRPNAESMFAIAPGAVGGAAADAFTAKLRLTNRARLGFAISSDPIPGSFTTSWLNSWFGARDGRLDFTPVPGSAACVARGPFGMKPPCVPPASQIDPGKVYGWLDGGGGPGTRGNALQGWTIFKGRFDGSAVRAGLDPTRLVTIAESVGRPATRTNMTPLAIDFPTGRRTIDASFGYFFCLVCEQPLPLDRHPVPQHVPEDRYRSARSRNPLRFRQIAHRYSGARVHRPRGNGEPLRRQGLHRSRARRARDRNPAGEEAEPDRSGRDITALQQPRRPHRRQFARRAGRTR